MNVKVKMNGIHFGKPLHVDVDVEMSPKEMVSYVKEVAPLIKSMVAVQKETNALTKARLKIIKKDKKC